MEQLLRNYSFKKKDNTNWIYEEFKENFYLYKVIYNTKRHTMYANNFKSNKHFFGFVQDEHEFTKILDLCEIHCDITC